MLTLKTGEFFGNIESIFRGSHFTLSVTDYDQHDPHASERHYHLHPNMYFILYGGVLEKYGGATFHRLAGNLSFYHAGQPHQNIRKLFPLRTINIELEQPFFDRNNVRIDQLEKVISKNPDAKFLMLKLHQETETNDAFTATSLEMSLLALLTGFEKSKNEKPWPPWMKRLYELLQDRWDEVLTLEEISRHTGVHPITVSKHFPRFLGCSLGQYMRKLKIERSLSLMHRCESLSALAVECGFSDQSHFIRAFRQYTGYRPLEFKRMIG